MPDSAGQYDTVIGADACFKGEMAFENGVQVLGRFEGRIESKGNLHVAEGGKLKADVTAGNVQIDGIIKGNVAASGKVLLKSSARLEGDLKTARLEVAEGAVFVGNCQVGLQAKDNNGAVATGAGTAGSGTAGSGKAPPKNNQPAKSKTAEPVNK